MDVQAAPEINNELCVRCGRCVRVCAADLLEMTDEGVEPSGDVPCFVCGHCIAVCPEDAITHSSLDAEGFTRLFSEEDRVTVDCLWDLLRRRRSVRQYTDEPVAEETIMQLIEAATLAPSALNEQAWHFNVITDPDQLHRICRRIVALYRSLLKMLGGRWSKLMLRLMVGADATEQFEEARPLIQRIVDGYEADDDRILWGAPTLIVVHSPDEDHTTTESSHYAVGNLILMATAMGLGTCLIGFLTAAAEHDERLQKYLGIPEGNTIDAALVLGHPDVDWIKSVPRRTPPIKIT